MAENVIVEDISNYTGGAYTEIINQNFERLANAFDQVIWKDGREKSTADIDVNGYRILNLPAPVSDLEPVRKVDIASIIPVYADTANSILSQAQIAATQAQEAAAAAELSASTVDYGDIAANRSASQDAASAARTSAVTAQTTVANLLNGSQVFSGAISRDSQFYLNLSASNPVVNFDNNDYISFDRTSDVVNVVIGGTTSVYVNSSGIFKQGEGAYIRHFDPTNASGRIIVKTAAAPDPVTYQKGDLIATI